MIFLSSLGGAYLELHIISKLNHNLPILSQEGLSEWFLIKFSNKISYLIAFDISLSQTVLGLVSLIISFLLLFWILSTSKKEINFFKFISRPIFLPLVWILTMFSNLLFYDNTIVKNELRGQKSTRYFKQD